MGYGKVLIVGLALALGFGGIAKGLSDWREEEAGATIQLEEVRKNDDAVDAALVGNADDDDDTGGGDATNGGNTANGGSTNVENTGTGGATNGGNTATGGATNGANSAGDSASNGTAGNSNGGAVEGRTAAQWQASAQLYKERWLQEKQANAKHAAQVRRLRASARAAAPSPRPRVVARGGGGGGNSGGGDSNSGGGDT